jgi:rRNA-processing protein FCF1
MGVALQLLIVDANVLIDFCKTQPSILALVTQYLGGLHVAAPVLDEVNELDVERAEALGIVVVTPELAMAREAAMAAVKSPLGFADWLCLLLAKEKSWVCVTNDKRLRAECDSRQVEALWGFQLLHQLVQCRAMTAPEALKAAEAICSINRRISASVLAAFAKKLAELVRPR